VPALVAHLDAKPFSLSLSLVQTTKTTQQRQQEFGIKQLKSSVNKNRFSGAENVPKSLISLSSTHAERNQNHATDI